ncbi:hypothetical protein [Kordiimonas sp.]|uniref:hypothetical protein n=1 Tax=Kordiimonas sp. TaxID=1970157 RepID=UPI003A9076FE
MKAFLGGLIIGGAAVGSAWYFSGPTADQNKTDIDLATQTIINEKYQARVDKRDALLAKYEDQSLGLYGLLLTSAPARVKLPGIYHTQWNSTMQETVGGEAVIAVYGLTPAYSVTPDDVSLVCISAAEKINDSDTIDLLVTTNDPNAITSGLASVGASAEKSVPGLILTDMLQPPVTASLQAPSGASGVLHFSFTEGSMASGLLAMSKLNGDRAIVPCIDALIGDPAIIERWRRILGSPMFDSPTPASDEGSN